MAGNYETKNFEAQGGDYWEVGGVININQADGGEFQVDGVPVSIGGGSQVFTDSVTNTGESFGFIAGAWQAIPNLTLPSTITDARRYNVEFSCTILNQTATIGVFGFQLLVKGVPTVTLPGATEVAGANNRIGFHYAMPHQDLSDSPIFTMEIMPSVTGMGAVINPVLRYTAIEQ